MAVLLTACAGSGGSSVAAVGATSKPASSSPRVAPGSAPPVRRCEAADLAVTFGAASTVAEAQYQLPVVLTNRSPRRCSVTGYPGVQLVARDGSTYDVPRSPLVRSTRIVLSASASAHANLTYLSTEAHGSGAFTPTSVRITPPDTFTSVTLAWSHGPVLDQSGATHPGTYVTAFAAG